MIGVIDSAHLPAAHFKLNRHTDCTLISAEDRSMSLVRLLGFRAITCGCVIGKYRELATSREITYIEEKGSACEMYGHRRTHRNAAERTPMAAEPLNAFRAA